MDPGAAGGNHSGAVPHRCGRQRLGLLDQLQGVGPGAAVSRALFRRRHPELHPLARDDWHGAGGARPEGHHFSDDDGSVGGGAVTALPIAANKKLR